MKEGGEHSKWDKKGEKIYKNQSEKQNTGEMGNEKEWERERRCMK